MDRKKIPGRAEFKKKSEVSDCFEGVPALAMLAPLFAYSIEKDGRTRLLIGNRGTGKTHLLKLMAIEGTPIQLYELDKEKLEKGKLDYYALFKHTEPAAVVVDDLHYLLKAMYVAQLKGMPLKEEQVLDRLAEFRTLAEILEAPLIFVADEGPAGLSMRFAKPESKKRFLGLMDSCTDTPDDCQMYYKHLGTLGPTSHHKTVNLDYRGCMQSYERVEIPLSVAPRIWPNEVVAAVDTQTSESLGHYWADPVQVTELTIRQKELLEQIIKHAENPTHKTTAMFSCDEFCWPLERVTAGMNTKLQDSMKKASDRLMTMLNMTDIPFAFVTGRFVGDNRYGKSLTRYQVFYPFADSGRIDSSRAFTEEYGHWIVKEKPETPLATIRELEVVAKAVGGISRETLGLAKLGALITVPDSAGNRQGMVYTRDDINAIRSRIRKIFGSAVKYDPRSLVDCLLYARTNEEMLAGQVEAELALE